MHVLMGVWYFLLNLIRSQEAQVEIHVSEVGLPGTGLPGTSIRARGRICWQVLQQQKRVVWLPGWAYSGG